MIGLPRIRWLALAALIALLGAPICAAREVPFLSGRVNDTAELIPAETEQRIEEKLAALEGPPVLRWRC